MTTVVDGHVWLDVVRPDGRHDWICTDLEPKFVGTFLCKSSYRFGTCIELEQP